MSEIGSGAMRKIISVIQKRSSGKNVIAFFIPAMVIYLTMLFYTIPQVEKHASGMKLFDLMPGGYSFEYAIELLAKLGESGRELYLYYQLPLDYLYPGLFAVSCSLLLSWLLLKSRNKSSKLFYSCFIPIVAGVFDYLENSFIVYFLTHYPNISSGSVYVSSAMTLAKSVMTTLSFVFLIVAVLAFYSRKDKQVGV